MFLKHLQLFLFGSILFLASAGNILAQQDSKSVRKINEKETKLGKNYYSKYSCNSCHGNNGKAQGDLTQAYQKYTDKEIISYIKRPDNYQNLKMPVYSEVIPDSVFPALVKYVKYLGVQANQKKK